VRPGKSKPAQIVVKGCTAKRRVVVAIFAGCRKIRAAMIQVRGLSKVHGMAAHARRWRSGKFTADMTGSTRNCRVGSRERKLCRRIVIKTRVLPAVHTVAAFTIRGKTRRAMIDLSCLFVVPDMT
jgi:hypothetical protein